MLGATCWDHSCGQPGMLAKQLADGIHISQGLSERPWRNFQLAGSALWGQHSSGCTEPIGDARWSRTLALVTSPPAGTETWPQIRRRIDCGRVPLAPLHPVLYLVGASTTARPAQPVLNSRIPHPGARIHTSRSTGLFWSQDVLAANVHFVLRYHRGKGR
jgi:hypothetical protein